MEDLFSVKDKIVLITGSSRGLGASLAAGFAEHGATVIINGTNPENVKQRVAAIRQLGGRAAGYVFDVADPDQVQQNVAKIEAEVGPVEVLINNAGIQRRGPLTELSLENWNAVIQLNLSAVFVISQAVVKRMIERSRGKIINITSLMAEGARATTGNYSAAKGGLKMLTKSMATEWGQYNLQVNAIGPGYFLTDLTKPLADEPKFDAWVKQEVPLQRWGDPAELIGAAIFLASKASSYINGQTIYVDGGWLASL